MSSILDLAGTTYTILADTTETYWKITNSVAGGKLVMEAGSKLLWEDREDCGFDPNSEAFSIEVKGNSEARCYIKSDVDYPNYRWTLPGSAVSVLATRGVFLNYLGSIPTTWTLNNCDAYADPLTLYAKTALRNLTGTELSDEVLGEILGHASDEIEADLIAEGIEMPSLENPILKNVLLNKSLAGVLTRYRIDGTRVGAINVDGVTSGGDNIVEAIKSYEEKATRYLKSYIRENLPSDRYRFIVKKVNT